MALPARSVVSVHYPFAVKAGILEFGGATFCFIHGHNNRRNKLLSLNKQTLTELCFQAVERYGKKVCFQMYRDGGICDRLSYEEFGVKVRRFAFLLKCLGVKAGDRVMILSENRPGWPIAYFGTVLAGAVTVPVLVDFPAEQVKAIASHAGISALCYTGKTAPKITGIDPAIPAIRIDLEPADKIALDQEFTEGPPPALSDFPVVNEEDPASILYTSGTTGNSKGVQLSHRNLVSNAVAARNLIKLFSRDRLLSVLPLAHTYECTIGMLLPVTSGASVTYLDKPPSPAVLLPAMQAIRPTGIVSVPLLIEKICRSKIFPELEKNPLYKFPLTRSLVIWAAGQKLMAALGSSIRIFGVGGASLSEDVERFLRKAGFPYTPGYGLTETSPLLTGTTPYKFPLRTCGTALEGTELRIGDDGEIQVRGPQVMIGYYKDEKRTREAFTEDGWFKTGDLGRLDKKGRLFIYGRLKALILGPSGENIYPEEIECLLNTSQLVEDALVVPGARGELVALVVLSEKAKTMIAALSGSLEDLKNTVNKKLTAFSRLSRIVIHPEPFEKTPTLKIKRFLYSAPKEQALPGEADKMKPGPAGANA